MISVRATIKMPPIKAWLIYFLPIEGITIGYLYMQYGKSDGNDIAKGNNLIFGLHKPYTNLKADCMGSRTASLSEILKNRRRKLSSFFLLVFFLMNLGYNKTIIDINKKRPLVLVTPNGRYNRRSLKRGSAIEGNNPPGC